MAVPAVVYLVALSQYSLDMAPVRQAVLSQFAQLMAATMGFLDDLALVLELLVLATVARFVSVPVRPQQAKEAPSAFPMGPVTPAMEAAYGYSLAKQLQITKWAAWCRSAVAYQSIMRQRQAQAAGLSAKHQKLSNVLLLAVQRVQGAKTLPPGRTARSNPAWGSVRSAQHLNIAEVATKTARAGPWRSAAAPAAVTPAGPCRC